MLAREYAARLADAERIEATLRESLVATNRLLQSTRVRVRVLVAAIASAQTVPLARRSAREARDLIATLRRHADGVLPGAERDRVLDLADTLQSNLNRVAP